MLMEPKRSRGRIKPLLLLRRRPQPVEKPLHAPFCVPFEDLMPRSCSVLAVVYGRFDAVLDYRPVGHRLFQQADSFHALR
jgi:hypothetical protein